jgi:hypothetical protein
MLGSARSDCRPTNWTKLAAAVAEAERRAQRRARLIHSAGGPDLGNETVMSGAWV